MRIPNATRVEQIAAFPEPDHTPEIDKQRALEVQRDGNKPTIEEMYPTDEERAAWYAGVDVDDEPSSEASASGADPSTSRSGDDQPTSPSAVPRGTEERAVEEREKLRVWRKGGEKGPRPATPSVEALGARRGCVKARTD